MKITIPMPYPKWTVGQLRFLRLNYRRLQHQEIAEAIGKTRNAVRNKAWDLRLRKKSPPYSDAELCLISSLYRANVPLAEIAVRLKRPKTCVCSVAKKLGLTDISRMKQLTDSQRQELSNRVREWLKSNGHPRGCREIRTCPMCGKFFEVKRSLRQECCNQSCATKKRMKGMSNFSRSKAGKRSDLANQYFRSNYEANYARYLNFVIEQGCDIVGWDFEPDTFEFKNIKKGTRFYTPDFKVHLKDGHIEYHEVKGWDYPKGVTQRKRFAKYYPHLKLLVIDGDFFKDIKRRGFDKLIPNWE